MPAPAPTPDLHTGFSEPGATPTPWEDVVEVLESAELFWLTTVRPDGRPHVTPLVAAWLDDVLHFSTGPTEQKALNLRSNPHVILSTGCNRWHDGLDVVVEGDAVSVTDEPMLRRLAEAWTRKWDGRWRFEVRDGAFSHVEGGRADVFAVRPTKVLAFGKGSFSQTRFRF